MKSMRTKSLLLLGPTGSGKTPLGDLCEAKGLWGKRCAHLDFGVFLRSIAETGRKPQFLNDDDMEVVLSVLKTGALLENEHFHIAMSILRMFAEEKKLEYDDLLLLNGLPRHAGQARDVDAVIDVRFVLYIRCSPEVVVERIRRNSGGDREGRVDDSPDDIRRKLRIFEEKTVPLLDHYRAKKVAIEEYEVAVDTTSEEIYGWLNGKNGTRIFTD